MKAAAEVHQAAGGLVVSDPGILGGKPVFRGANVRGRFIDEQPSMWPS